MAGDAATLMDAFKKPLRLIWSEDNLGEVGRCVTGIDPGSFARDRRSDDGSHKKQTHRIEKSQFLPNLNKLRSQQIPKANVDNFLNQFL